MHGSVSCQTYVNLFFWYRLSSLIDFFPPYTVLRIVVLELFVQLFVIAAKKYGRKYQCSAVMSIVNGQKYLKVQSFEIRRWLILPTNNYDTSNRVRKKNSSPTTAEVRSLSTDYARFFVNTWVSHAFMGFFPLKTSMKESCNVTKTHKVSWPARKFVN